MKARTLINISAFILVLALGYLTLSRYNPQLPVPATIVNRQLVDYQHPSQPVVDSKVTLPQLSTDYFIVVDNLTNQVLASSKPNERIFPASTTKLATALTALNIYPLDEVVTVKDLYTEGKIMNLQIGEKITIRSLVDALLVYSANDSAFNLASYHLGGVSGFVDEMNNIIKKNNLTNTHFTNFDGIHNEQHYSTVFDLSQLARLALKNKIIREVVQKKELTVSDVTTTIHHPLVTTNELLGKYPEIKGLKTGFTPESLGSFIALIDLEGHELITVVARSEDRFTDTVTLLEWAKNNITWQEYSP